ncbi:MAG: caspase family protein, partial [Planctomycetales bacterium]|nr:caspase family protein [Planctomycetales bacterium]
LNGLTDEVLVPENPNAQEFEIDRLLSLQSGENEVALIAANAEATSAAETLFVQVAREVPTSTRRMNLLAIGISEYATADDRLDLLPHAAADARHFAATAVTQAAGKLYSEVQTRVIQNADANRTEILQGMQWLVDNTQDGDTAVIFLSAYCFLDSTANFYVGTHEVDMSRPRATAISWREFIKTLHEDLPSCRRLVFLDLQPTEQAIAPGQRNPLLDLAAPELATTFFSSTALQQTRPLQPNRQRGYLTEALAHVLHDPASDVEPQPTDNLLSNSEVSQAWQSQFQRLTAGKLFPVAYVPAGNRRHAVFDLTNIK